MLLSLLPRGLDSHLLCQFKFKHLEQGHHILLVLMGLERQQLSREGMLEEHCQRFLALRVWWIWHQNRIGDQQVECVEVSQVELILLLLKSSWFSLPNKLKPQDHHLTYPHLNLVCHLTCSSSLQEMPKFHRHRVVL